MITVTLNLEHEGEVHLLQQFVGFLRTARADWATRGGFDSPVPPGSELVTADAPLPNNPMPEPAAGITTADLEAALMDFAKKNGTPAAVELLASFGIKRLPELDQKDYARFYAKAYA